MTTENSSDNLDRLLNKRCSEDPYRLPHEKETGIHLKGDEDHISVTSFKEVVYGKLLRRPDFDLDQLIIQDVDGREYTVDSLEEVLADPAVQIVGANGKLPAGALSIRKPRNSDSHARIVA
ncbi:hypothetical protein EA462_02425 [Natrarchaeobius halalkaliphilus]|uniref:Uncharacterized protein n=1 Tax=Natrarchaeobius halalkaliphilus TaxID=1679091 RepID=A0A3N6MC69_9EURY|nr:hypothetical protein [Natrarchaeobius halalkaliphilus]RQG93081.1 hypothetical protein EA462_02425 [Natrarchaeobius halalkaliphilus]